MVPRGREGTAGADAGTLCRDDSHRPLSYTHRLSGFHHEGRGASEGGSIFPINDWALGQVKVWVGSGDRCAEMVVGQGVTGLAPPPSHLGMLPT